MDSKFNPPKSQAEFEERANTLDLKGALGVLNALRNRRASMIRPIDTEIEFYEYAIEHLNKNNVDWNNKTVVVPKDETK